MFFCWVPTFLIRTFSTPDRVNSRFFYAVSCPTCIWSCHLFIYSFIHLFIYSFIHLFIYSFIHLFIYSFIHLFIYSFIHLLFYNQFQLTPNWANSQLFYLYSLFIFFSKYFFKSKSGQFLVLYVVGPYLVNNL